MAAAGHLYKVMDQVLAVSGDDVWDHFGAEAAEELRVASDVPGVKQRDSELQVVALEFTALSEASRPASDAHPHVPQGARNGGNFFLVGRLDTGLCGQEKQINVRMGVKFTAAVPTYRQQAKVVGTVSS